MLLSSKGAAEVRPDPLPTPDDNGDAESTLDQLVPRNQSAKDRAQALVTFAKPLERAAQSALSTSTERGRAVLDSFARHYETGAPLPQELLAKLQRTRTFRAAIIGFVQIVREKHPDTPYVVVSPIYSPPRETTPNTVEFTLQAMRDEVAAAVDALRAAGDHNVHYVNGLDVFGAAYTHLLPDELHPDAEGYRLMGQNFTAQVADQYFR